jgi:uncharacterized protein YjiS (DUF1127 family)
MKHTRAITGIQHAFGFTGILQGYDLSSKVYALVQKLENAGSLVKATTNAWTIRAKGRNDLARMSPRMLQDIGLDRAEVQMEINKPFWKK